MIKKLSIISGIFFILINFNFAIAHVLHYDKLNKLVFDLYWNNQIIGQHIYIFNREGKHLTVKNTIDIKIKKLGINFYEYFSEGIEIYVDGKFESFASKTNHNKKEKFVNIDKKDGQFYINGSSYKGIAPDNFILGREGLNSINVEVLTGGLGTNKLSDQVFWYNAAGTAWCRWRPDFTIGADLYWDYSKNNFSNEPPPPRPEPTSRTSNPLSDNLEAV